MAHCRCPLPLPRHWIHLQLLRMALAASFCRGAARILAVESQSFLSFANYPNSFNASTNKNGQWSKTNLTQYWPSLFFAAAAACIAYGDDCDVASCNAHKKKVSSANQKGGKRSIKDPDTYLIDPDDPNDLDFDLVIKYKVPIEEARQ